ncbi:2-amino-4-hydroxy-6-hydroxymethyldihydropteridine diphosphokinase [Subtercola endophyticus]|uniref:2-amino-4-hydroxy-6- hydroxymethyldihydropteridine diphosphokinase n=1 Tax=Subtercola endophyticus TaxID=2895559 RepID=UPI001E65A993|nr:2-amino-4-hydroxy-6-hydroxymethyldihydropteridine diphosphokinase [Subtercola endophyticus]UFS59073.1 2-amino-4-hydroxy-6-hydroxymethyldihydropteridine diphosphokinase [Subtercola endophyticus]
MTKDKASSGLPATIALGSNLGDREATLRAAVGELADTGGIVVDSVSSLYETDALKPDGVDLSAPAYLNAVMTVHTTLDPHALLRVLNSIEEAHDRVRAERWGDRTIDLDIITFAGLQQHDETLTLPHPRAYERAFVLAPWHEIEPNAELPGRGPIATLLAATYESPRLYSRWSR